MNEYFRLVSTYDVLLEASGSTRVIRLEIMQSMESPKKLRARAWEQSTYNLYPTFANPADFDAASSKLWSSDQINREITVLLSDDPTDLVLGKEWESEAEYLAFLKGLVRSYNALFSQ